MDRRKRQHPAYGNQTRGPNHSHRRLHFNGDTLKRIHRREKNAGAAGAELRPSVAALHLTLSGLRGTVRIQITRRIPMRDLFIFPQKLALGATLGVVLGLFAFGQSAQAANPLELNFWLSGPKYDGQVAPCEAALSTITSQFREKESTFWNSDLTITAYGAIRETAFRPWQSDNIPRRYCSGDVMLSDGKQHHVHYSIIEDGGFASFGQGVEWCITGLDRNWAYSPACRSARP
jgi:hypothetical protein